jgi:serine protease Do
MDNGMRAAGRARAGSIVAVVACVATVGAFGLHRVWAAEPAAGRHGGGAAISSAALAERTVALANLENGFTAIADKLEPSVVSIRIEKKVQMPGMGGGDIDRFFNFPGFGGQGDDDDNAAPLNPRAPQGNRPRVFTFPRGGMQPIPRTFNERGSGSGVIVRSDGWILTNDHVVGGADKVTVTLHDGRTFSGTVRRDYRSDLALVKIPASGLEPAEFADSDRVRVGQWAIAFGSPFELDETMTVGIISARQRQKEIIEDGQGRFYPSLLQTDASINPGNSGGALVDITGRVVGINVAINTTTGGSVGIGFAIPANTARNVMEQLISKGKVTRGFLGVKPSTLTPDRRSTYGVREGGALVEQVTEGTPADKAGFQVEDVVVRYNGKPVMDEVTFRDMVASTPPGTKVDVVIRRDGHEVTLTPTIGTLPDELTGASPAEPVQPTPRVEKTNAKLGVTVAPVTKDLLAQYKLPANAAGVVVTAVEPGSAASEAGLQPGMVVQRANGHRVSSAADLASAVSSAKSGDQVRLVVQIATSTGHTTALIPVSVP